MRMSPRIQAIITFIAVIAAAALAAFIRSLVSGEPFSLNWDITLIAAAALAAIFYIGPPLVKRIANAFKKDGSNS